MGERILRFPFRMVGVPLRWLGRAAAFGGGFMLYSQVATQPVFPLFSFGSTTGLMGGLRINAPWAERDSSDWTGSLRATLSFNDHRQVMLAQRIGRKDAPVGFELAGGYNYAPNLPFYGIGNFSDQGRRSIYLAEEGLVDASLLVGSDGMRQVRLIGGYSNISARPGYDRTTRQSLEEEFLPSEVPFFLKKSRVISYGARADFAALNDRIFPSSGIHGIAELRRIHGLGDTGVEYMQWHLEGRGYIPVFAARRTIAVRVLHQGVDPLEGTRPVPFYRLPVSEGETGFTAYRAERFRDQQLLLAHLEYRWQVWDFASAFVFTQWGAVAPSADQFRYADGHESHGGGFRFGFLDHAARLEFARGPEGMRLRFGGGF